MKLKKWIALILAMTMALSLAACGKTQKSQDEYVAVQIREDMEVDSLKDKLSENNVEEMSVPGNILYVDTLNEALMTLKSGKATGFMTTEATAVYVAARDSELKAVAHPDSVAPLTLHIVALPESDALMEQINGAIRDMKSDGTLDAIYAEHVTAVLESGEPAAVEIPAFEGAETITIGVSGDLPPVDYVNADGEPTGFNVAVIAEIAKRLEMNIQIEIVASGTRFMALDSKRINAFFWEMDVIGKDSGYLLSESYAEMRGGIVINKDQKRLS